MMLYILGLITGASATLALMLAVDWQNEKRAHSEHVREWQSRNSSCSIIRSRHRRADKHKGYAPMPLDFYGGQLQQTGKLRAKRIGGKWA